MHQQSSHSSPPSTSPGAWCPTGLSVGVFSGNSGSEASSKAAIRFARRVGNEQGHQALRLRPLVPRPHHGRPVPDLDTPKYREPFAPCFPTGFLPWGDLAAIADRVGPKTAAVLVEPAGRGRSSARFDQFLGVCGASARSAALLIVDGSSAASAAREKCSRTSMPISLPTSSPWRSLSAVVFPWARRSLAGTAVLPRRSCGRSRFHLRRQPGVRGASERHSRSAPPRPVFESIARRASSSAAVSRRLRESTRTRSWTCAASASCRASNSRTTHPSS